MDEQWESELKHILYSAKYDNVSDNVKQQVFKHLRREPNDYSDIDYDVTKFTKQRIWKSKLQHFLDTKYKNLSSHTKQKVIKKFINKPYNYTAVKSLLKQISNKQHKQNVSKWQKTLTAFLNKNYKNLPSNIKHTVIKQHLNKPYNYYDVRVDVNKKLYQAVMPELRSYLRDPLMSKHELDLLEAYAIRMVTHNRGLSNKIFCGNYVNIGQKFYKWLIWVLNNDKQNRKIYLNSFATTVIQHRQQYSKHLRIWEYILIPLVLFMLPDVVSAFLMFVTGGFFIFVGTGAMMYAEHFVTVYAIPRLVLAVIGDGIAYWINKKRDEQV